MVKLRSNAIVYGAILCVFVLFIATVAEARGRRGGGRSFSRSGPASRGSFSSRPNRTQQPSRQVKRSSQDRSSRPNQGAHLGTDRGGSRDKNGDKKRWDEGDREEAKEKWQEGKEERQEKRQEAIKDRQEDRQDYIDDHYDDDWDNHHGVVVVGVAATTAYIVTLPCATDAVVVDGVSYYKCSSTWYKRSYAGSQVTYVTVKAPPGY